MLMALLTFLPKGFIDFPCMVRYDEQKSCLENPHHTDTCTASIEIYLTTYQAGWSGGGCHFADSVTNSLDVHTPVLDITLTKAGETIDVNMVSLSPSEGFYHMRVLHWNPWIISKIGMRNLGFVRDCQSECIEPKIVLTGYYGTHISLVKGGSILTCLFALFVVTRRKVKRFRHFKQ
jgi:hypothetical protein